MRNLRPVLGTLAILGLMLAACSPSRGTPSSDVGAADAPASGSPSTALPPGSKILKTSFLSGDVPTLDPALAEDSSSIQILLETMVGLTHLNEITNALEPGIATEWDIVDNADGTQTITFHLRNDVPWVRWNGEAVETVRTCDGSADRMVNAVDFAYGIKRNLLPASASPYAYLLAFVLQGAADFNNGVTDDFSTVGVNVIDDQTIELTFMAPAAYNAQIAGLWVAYPSPKWIIEGDCDGAVEARGERWTEPGFNQGFGPFVLREWIHDSELEIVRNPFWPGSPEIPQAKLDGVRFLMLDEPAQLAEYEAGNLDNERDVPLSDLDRIKVDPVLGPEFSIAPQLCTYTYAFNSTAPFVDDARVRRALSLAVDRQSLIDNVTKGEQQPAQWFSRPGLAAAPTIEDHPDLGIKYDPDAARAELQSYLDETGLKAEDLDITLMFNTSSAHEAIAEAVQGMWATNLGVQVKLVNQEFAVFLETTKSLNTPQIYRAAWCQDYPDANNFLREVWAANGANNPVDANGDPAGGLMWKNDRFEQLMAEAAVDQDPAKRLEMYAEAEDILVKSEAVVLPLYWYTNLDLTKPYVIRTFSSTSSEAYEKWDMTSP
jgi:oligopeptide transport system substrate-binding protein